MSETPKVSFITVCYRTPNLIRVLLKGIERANFSFPFEYFLVDNGQDGTAAMVRERFPWVTVLAPGANVGFARGNNLAFRRAAGTYCMLVNPDLTVFPGQMEALLAFADTHPDIGMAGPRIENPNGTRQETCTRFPTPLTPVCSRTVLGKIPWGRSVIDRYLMRDIPHDEPHDADGLYGSALLIRRSVLEDVGYFDEGFFMYYEDVDLCRRVWERGWRVTYVPVARFVHYHQRESLVRTPLDLFTNRLLRIHIASGVRYFWKYRNTPFPARHIVLERPVKGAQTAPTETPSSLS